MTLNYCRSPATLLSWAKDPLIFVSISDLSFFFVTMFSVRASEVLATERPFFDPVLLL